MSVLIKGMEMPKSCDKCQFNRLDPTGEILLCDLTLFAVSWDEKERPFDCPLISVPDHGRLVDADALKKEWRNGFHRKIVDALMEDAPTIIPADPPKEDGE